MMFSLFVGSHTPNHDAISISCNEGIRLNLKLKGSLESQLCGMVFCWGKHMKEHVFLNVDPEQLRQIHEGMFH